MKRFSNVSRAATCASGVILESWPARSVPESVVAKRRDSVTLRPAKHYGMTTKNVLFLVAVSVNCDITKTVWLH